MKTEPCPRCGRLDRVYAEVDERQMVETIRCTRCPRVKVTTPLSAGHSAHDPPAGLAAWNSRPRQQSLFE